MKKDAFDFLKMICLQRNIILKVIANEQNQIIRGKIVFHGSGQNRKAKATTDACGKIKVIII